jgi:predicted nucleic acid-binding protein
LLALIDSKAEEGINTLPVVLDANVLYRLQDPVPQDEPSQRVMSEEARSLEADWLGDGIQLLITPELFNELQRQEDEDLRKSRLCFANRYRKVNTTLEETRRWEHEIQVLFPENPNDNTKSDIRQLAYAAASDVAFFITQDQGILKRSDTVYQKSGLRILAPGQLVGRLDEAIREVEYRPKRLAGTSTLMNSRLHSNQVTNLYPHLRCLSRQEKIHEFESKLRAFMAQPDRYSIQVILRKDGPPLALIVYDTDNPQELSIPMFRVSRSSIASTVLRYVLGKIVLRSASEKRQITRLHSDCANEDFRRSLRELGFAPVDDHWIKINLPSIKYSNALIKELQYIGEKFVIAKPLARALSTSIKEAVDQNDTLALVDIERRLWPAKVRDAPVENFIVPIKPYWAQHLFDEGIAQQTLWGAKESLVLSNENVYYRKVQNSRGISAPARILWYVTSGKPSYLTKQVRACSILDEVIVGRPSDLFRRFERLGVYEWQHLRELVEGNLDKNIMALKFSNTELFQEPVSLDGVREILQEVEGKSPQPLSPQRISTKAFALIYLMSSDV